MHKYIRSYAPYDTGILIAMKFHVFKKNYKIKKHL